MKPRDLFRVSITGIFLTAFLITVLSVFGIVSRLTRTDFVLFPMLGAFVILGIYSSERIRRDRDASERDGDGSNPSWQVAS